jgi:hypothetical protein
MDSDKGEPQRTPAGERSGKESTVLVRRYSQRLQARLSVQRELNLSMGIVRGARDEGGRPLPDHVVGANGSRLFGEEMRRDTISVWEHQIRALSTGARTGPARHQRVVAAVGNGNLTQNPAFVAWLGEEDGRLLRLRAEPVMARVYDCVVLTEGGVGIRRVRFVPKDSHADETGWRALDVDDDERPLPSEAVAFSGQRLVRGGRPLGPGEFARQVMDGLYHDLRHVFRFPAVRVGSHLVDVGLEQFFPGGVLDRGLLAEALGRAPIRTRWTELGVGRPALVRALADKAYRPGSSGEPGTYRFDGEHLDLSLLEGIYPHNVFGLDAQGRPQSLLVTGWSNNVGYTLGQLSEVAGALFEDALLLDNGGDVFFLENRDPDALLAWPALAWHQGGHFAVRGSSGCEVYGFSEGRVALRSVLLFVEDVDDRVEHAVEAVTLRSASR